ncbi:MAG TPA: hypothetical protein VFT42_11455, partial [Solirubrobacteraceae bacterium]|nr:hypothetical protein [Solirubrobacteraceae bacterium]
MAKKPRRSAAARTPKWAQPPKPAPGRQARPTARSGNPAARAAARRAARTRVPREPPAALLALRERAQARWVPVAALAALYGIAVLIYALLARYHILP